jgi:hypothetical protein
MAEILKTDWVHTGLEYPKAWESAIDSVSRRMSISKRAVMRQCLQVGLPILSANAEALAQVVRDGSRKPAPTGRNRTR